MTTASETAHVHGAAASRPERAAAASSVPYARVMVPVAGVVDEHVARLAVALADRLGVPAEVLAVVSAGLEDVDGAQLRSEIAELGVTMDVDLLTDAGDVVGQVLAEAASRRGLLCLGTRGATALGEALFGSVADDLIRRSRREVLVIGPNCEPRLDGDTVVIAIDGSAGARAIVPAAVDLARALDLRPRLVEVLPGRGVSLAQSRLDLARLDDLAPFAELAQSDGDQVLVQGSRVDDALVAMSELPHVAMLAMATHGLGRIERLLGGSVTLDVIREARCPVLVAPR